MRNADDWLALLHQVPDPEIPVLNVVEMGIVRNVEVVQNCVEVKITPTYMGCPAMDAIADDIRAQLTPLASEEGRARAPDGVDARRPVRRGRALPIQSRARARAPIPRPTQQACIDISLAK